MQPMVLHAVCVDRQSLLPFPVFPLRYQVVANEALTTRIRDLILAFQPAGNPRGSC